MKNNYTHITFVLDRSGSMSSCWSDVEGGYKEFVSKQKELKDSCTFSLIAFDNNYDTPVNFKDIQLVTEDIKELNINPRGGTALYDAIGRAISETGEKLAALNESDRPEKVIVVIQTDGYENASKEYTSQMLKEKIKEQEEKYNWQFMFIGADIAACTAAASFGIDASSIALYNTTKTGSTFDTINTKLYAARSAETYDAYSKSLKWTAEDLSKIQ